MRRSSVRFGLMVLLGVAAAAAAQVVPPQDIQDPYAQRLEQKYATQLQKVGRAIQAYH